VTQGRQVNGWRDVTPVPKRRHDNAFRAGRAPTTPHLHHSEGNYQAYTEDLVRRKGPVVERDFVIEFSGPGVDAYSFTFG
jgi:hypothetical protein